MLHVITSTVLHDFYYRRTKHKKRTSVSIIRAPLLGSLIMLPVLLSLAVRGHDLTRSCAWLGGKLTGPHLNCACVGRVGDPIYMGARTGVDSEPRTSNRDFLLFSTLMSGAYDNVCVLLVCFSGVPCSP